MKGCRRTSNVFLDVDTATATIAVTAGYVPLRRRKLACARMGRQRPGVRLQIGCDVLRE